MKTIIVASVIMAAWWNPLSPDFLQFGNGPDYSITEEEDAEPQIPSGVDVPDGYRITPINLCDKNAPGVIVGSKDGIGYCLEPESNVCTFC